MKDTCLIAILLATLSLCDALPNRLETSSLKAFLYKVRQDSVFRLHAKHVKRDTNVAQYMFSRRISMLQQLLLDLTRSQSLFYKNTSNQGK